MKNLPTIALFALALSLLSCGAGAQSEFPARSIRLIVGFPPGGSTDVLARTLAQESLKRLGHEVLVVNKPGVTGALAVGDVIASPADGYSRTPNFVEVAKLNALYNANTITGDALDQYLLKDRAGLVERATRLGGKKQQQSLWCKQKGRQE